MKPGEGRNHRRASGASEPDAPAEHGDSAEALPADGEQKFRNVIEASPLGVHTYTLDRDGRLVFDGFNAAAERILGVAHQQYVGKTLEDAFPPLAATEIPRRYRQVALTGEPWEHQQIDYQDEHIRGAFEIRAFQTEPRAMAVMFRDITEQMRVEERLRLAQFSLENCADAIFWIAPSARFVFVNQAACERLGYSREQLLTMSVFDIDPNFPAVAWDAHWQELARARALVLESVHRRSDGTEVPVEIMANYVEFSGKAYNCAIARDITERRRAARRLQEAHDSLEQRVKDRTTELVAANEQLKDVTVQLVHSARLAALGELTAGIAHELNQPLNSMKITVQGLLRNTRLRRLRHEGLLEKLELLVSTIDRMADILLHMRIFTRPRLGTQPEVIDLNQTVASAFAFVEQQLKDNEIDVVKRFADPPIRVRADPLGVEQVLLNVLTNARHALLPCDRADKRIVVETRREPSAAVISITDNGVGIAEEIRDKIFDPFFTTKEVGEGTGLGLPVSRKIMDEQQGTISFASQPGDYTRFELRFPLAAPDGQP